MPCVLEEIRDERTTRSGATMYVARLKMQYTFYAEDGSHVDAIVIGEAMDTADKVTNKAMSIAFKYACFQTFCIPTEEMKDSDPDAVTPEETVPKVALVDETKIRVLKQKMEKKGVTEEKILERFKLHKLEDMTVEAFVKCNNMLDKTKDAPTKQENKAEELGL